MAVINRLRAAFADGNRGFMDNLLGRSGRRD